MLLRLYGVGVLDACVRELHMLSVHAYMSICMCVFVHVCDKVCVHAHACVCVHVCVYMSAGGCDYVCMGV